MKLNKKQKRTATIASMAALLAVVLGMGGQTFAKYIETHEGATQATVAKFGIVANVQDMSGLFNATYPTTGTANVSGSDLLVAPGTSGSFGLNITGEAEVRTALTIEATGNTVLCDTYEPIKWSFDNFATAPLTFAQMTAALNDLTDSDIAPQDPISITKTISWKWEFETATDKEQNNKYDTILGNAVSDGHIVNTPTDYVYGGSTYKVVTAFNFGISVTLEQIQAA